MKTTTLSEKASNRPEAPSAPQSGGDGVPTRSRALLAYGTAFAVLLVGLSFVGGGFTLGRVLDSYRGILDAEIARAWFDLRFERLLFAAGVGGALSLCGVAFQAVLRNPLAEPYILGISGGASIGVLSAPWWWGAAAGLAVPAFAGGLGALILLVGAVRWARVVDPAQLILTGAVLNAIFGAGILLLFELSDVRSMAMGLQWVMGDLSLTLGDTVRDVWIVLAIGSATLLLVARPLDLLALGDEEAADLGIRPPALRWLVLVTASLVTAAVVSAAGPIGFVGLIVPHVVRRLHGVSHRRVIPFAVFGGAIFLMLADTAARVALPGRALPVGVVTALLGGPFFLGLLRRQGRGAP